MARRNLPFDTASNAGIVGPLTAEALERLPERYHAWASSPSAAPFRFRRAPHGWVRVSRADLRGRVELSIVRCEEDVDLDGPARLVRQLDYEDFAGRLILTPRFMALSLSHAFGDGTVALAAVRAVLSGQIERTTRRTRIPVLRALLATRQLNRAGLRAGRALQRENQALVATAPLSDPGQVTDSDTVAHAFLFVSAERLRARVSAERAASTTPVSTLDALSGVVFRAFRACLHDGTDLPIRMLVGLRRYLPEGLSARGNLGATFVIGTLRGRSWSAREAREALARASISPAAVTSHAIESLIRLRTASPRQPAGSPLLLTYNVLSGRLGADREDYLPGERTLATPLMVNRGSVLGPHCTITATGSDFFIATVDDSGILDLTRFAEAFEAELGNNVDDRALGLR